MDMSFTEVTECPRASTGVHPHSQPYLQWVVSPFNHGKTSIEPLLVSSLFSRALAIYDTWVTEWIILFRGCWVAYTHRWSWFSMGISGSPKGFDGTSHVVERSDNPLKTLPWRGTWYQAPWGKRENALLKIGLRMRFNSSELHCSLVDSNWLTWTFIYSSDTQVRQSFTWQCKTRAAKQGSVFTLLTLVDGKGGGG